MSNKNFKVKSWNAKPLPHTQEHSDLFFKFKHKNENLGLVDFKKNDLQLWRLDNDSKLGFFQKGLFLEFDWSRKGSWLSDPNEYRQYQINIENYTKLVWLTHDYIINQRFKNPVCVHYNPYIEKWIVHPGGSRKKILHYFGDESIEVLAFNNCEQELSFKKVFNSLDEIKNHFKKDDVRLVCVPDYGSLIPHVHFDQITIDKNIENYFLYLKEFFRTTKIIANFDLLEKFGYEENKILKEEKNIVKLKVSNPDDLDMVDRSLLLAPNFKNYRGYGVQIECT